MLFPPSSFAFQDPALGRCSPLQAAPSCNRLVFNHLLLSTDLSSSSFYQPLTGS